MRHLHIYYNAPYLLSPKSNITSDFHFSWVLQPSQEKLKTMLMQNFGVTNTVHYGRRARGVWRNQRASKRLKNTYAKFFWGGGGTNKVHYGRCARGDGVINVRHNT